MTPLTRHPVTEGVRMSKNLAVAVVPPRASVMVTASFGFMRPL